MTPSGPSPVNNNHPILETLMTCRTLLRFLLKRDITDSITVPLPKNLAELQSSQSVPGKARFLCLF